MPILIVSIFMDMSVKFLSLVLSICALGSWAPIFSSQTSPLTGYWLTRKHDTKMLSSVVHLTIGEDHTMVGQVVGGFVHLGQPLPERYCSRCGSHTIDGQHGVKKNQEVIGSVPMWGFVHKRDHLWVKGKVIRMKTGELLRASMDLIDDDTINLVVRYGIFTQSLPWKRLSKSEFLSLCDGDLSKITTDKSYRLICMHHKIPDHPDMHMHLTK